ncbi:unnamed protein product [Bursaphelenchus okinawaensis]|uniref:ubiquitinyl hydrolase 1 n=1 Tax=Bursaphelenchus okinawaensis TaxID=465554 RepID=A0A811KQ93_9BILA|nr:unnamed protein product [Bursaphelenchus okinawaensis]CAG9108553.1 unnamed protein product [Bursaphelenchus okinawaensis]
MGTTASSHLEKELNSDSFMGNERFYGLVNFGNTCYCNSVLQALYFCQPFRDKILAYKQQQRKIGGQKDNLLGCLAELFCNIATQKRRVGTIAPKRFVTKLKKDNELFDNFMQQDAHEFLNYLLNAISEALTSSEEKKREQQNGNIKVNGVKKSLSSFGNDRSGSRSELTWIQEIFQDHLNRYTKLSYRVLFPLELRLFNLKEENSDRLYDLVAVVVHCGSTPNRGHYITLVKSQNYWLLFDDDIVDKIEESTIEDFFGLSDCNSQKNSESAYILFYQARE